MFRTCTGIKVDSLRFLGNKVDSGVQVDPGVQNVERQVIQVTIILYHINHIFHD